MDQASYGTAEHSCVGALMPPFAVPPKGVVVPPAQQLPFADILRRLDGVELSPEKGSRLGFRV